MLNEIEKIIEFIINGIFQIWPYLVLTIPVAVFVRVSGASKYINKALNQKPLTSIVLATIIGAFSPFCSCGVIPVIASLLMGGVPLAPVMSFWLASPSMDPEIFFLSVSVIGWELAIWRLMATFLMSLGAGFFTHSIVKMGWLGNDYLKTDYFENKKPILTRFREFSSDILRRLKPAEEKLSLAEVNLSVSNSSCGCSANSAHVSTKTVMPESESRPKTFKEKCFDSIKSQKFREKLYNETKNATFMVAKFMVLAFFLEALILFYVPSEFIIGLLGKDNPFAIFTAAFVGIPVYTSSIPALAMMGGLLEQGMAPAAALAFLIAGPTTTIPAMAAVWKLASRKVFLIYVLFTLASAILMGYLFQFISLI
ncbi:permease [Bacteroidota bacterium]